jgi:hypothetical protein
MATSPAPASLAQPPSLRMTSRSLLPSILVNGVLVYLLYTFIKSQTEASDLVALLVASLPALLSEVVTIARRRQIDVLGTLVLAALAVTAVVSAIGGDPKLVLIRESFVTLALGVACLVSLLVPRLAPRPLMFYIIRYFATGNDPAKAEPFNARWQHPAFRRYMRHVTLLWGAIFVVEFLIRLYLVSTLSIKQYLAVGPVVFYAVLCGLIALTLSYGRRLAAQRQS